MLIKELLNLIESQSKISATEKEKLKTAGYEIEDMEKVWGDDYKGEYRWINDTLEGDTFGVQQDSEEEAWVDALQFSKQYKPDEDDLQESKSGAFGAAKKVGCPLCGAKPNSGCVGKEGSKNAGERLSTLHNERLRAARFRCS